MKRPGLWATLLLAGLAGGCAAGSRGDPPPALPGADGRRERDDAVVALLNGEPLTWRAVAERMIESDPRTAVETYVRWRVVEDRRKELGIAPTLDERRRRAEAYVARVRRTMPDAEFRARLASEGIDETAYVDRLAESEWMRQLLVLDLIVRYQAMTDGMLTVDRVVFADEAEARRFASRCREAGFDAAAEGLQAARPAGVRKLPRETFARTAPPVEPALDPWIVEAVDALSPGQATDVESSRTELKYVIRLVEKRPGRPAPFAEARAEVLRSVLQDPPTPEDIRAWIASRSARARIEYPAATPKGRGR
jgi:hypothetical protein